MNRGWSRGDNSNPVQPRSPFLMAAEWLRDTAREVVKETRAPRELAEPLAELNKYREPQPDVPDGYVLSVVALSVTAQSVLDGSFPPDALNGPLAAMKREQAIWTRSLN